MGGRSTWVGPRPLRRRRRAALLATLAMVGSLAVAAPAVLAPAGAATVPATYAAEGPAPIAGGQAENVTNGNLVAGAVHTVVAHPSDPNVLWIGTVNGGIWKTVNATAAQPHWVPLTDQQASLSIGALEMDPTVASNTVLLAGIGRRSSFSGTGGALTGLLRTADGGATWTSLGAPTLVGENITGVAPRGQTIVVAADGTGVGGVFRSTNGGSSFTRLTAAAGLDGKPAFDLVGDPANSARLYVATTSGIFTSNDTGATWTNVTNQVAPFISNTTGNVELSVQNPGGTNEVEPPWV